MAGSDRKPDSKWFARDCIGQCDGALATRLPGHRPLPAQLCCPQRARLSVSGLSSWSQEGCQSTWTTWPAAHTGRAEHAGASLANRADRAPAPMWVTGSPLNQAGWPGPCDTGTGSSLRAGCGVCSHPVEETGSQVRLCGVQPGAAPVLRRAPCSLGFMLCCRHLRSLKNC